VPPGKFRTQERHVACSDRLVATCPHPPLPAIAVPARRRVPVGRQGLPKTRCWCSGRWSPGPTLMTRATRTFLAGLGTGRLILMTRRAALSDNHPGGFEHQPGFLGAITKYRHPPERGAARVRCSCSCLAWSPPLFFQVVHRQGGWCTGASSTLDVLNHRPGGDLASLRDCFGDSGGPNLFAHTTKPHRRRAPAARFVFPPF